MFEEDAVARMEELGHQFFVFVNAESERVDDPLPRRDGDLGLIEPIIGGEYTKGRAEAATGRTAATEPSGGDAAGHGSGPAVRATGGAPAGRCPASRVISPPSTR